MAFPRAPKKSVSGRLKLFIKPKETVVEVDAEEPPSPPEKDHSDRLTFKVPRGFSIEMDASSIVSQQQKHASKALRRIRDKIQSCGNCRRKVTTAQIDLAEQVLNDVCGILAASSTAAVSITTGQFPTGEIEFKISADSRRLHIRVNTSFVEVGLYDNNTLQSDFTSVYPDPKVSDTFSWLTGA